MTSVEIAEFGEAMRKMIQAGKKDEAVGKASWPASLRDAAAVRQKLGGSVMEIAKADASGNVFGFVLADYSVNGVLSDGTLGCFPEAAKAAVTWGGGAKAAVDAVIQRWSSRVFGNAAMEARPLVLGTKVLVTPLRGSFITGTARRPDRDG